MKALAAYVLLVGVPLGGLAAVLRAGERLVAPPSVAGEWRIGAPSGDAARRTMRISQSGTHLSLRIAGAEIAATLRGDSLLAVDGVTSRAGCGRAVAARIDTAARPMRMMGILVLPSGGCAEIHGVRTTGAEKP